MDDGGVDALDGVLEELAFEVEVGGVVFGEDEEAGGVAVEAMDDADLCTRVVLGEVTADECDGGGTAFVWDGAGEEAWRFGDDEDVVVLVDEL